jgi:hypothetical protein
MYNWQYGNFAYNVT